MVYIHGESYSWGAGHIYDGSVLASYSQVIVVTLNYRLGPLGFLNMGESGDVVSNQGLMDLLAALSWVNHNIEEFGGDPLRVTLFGHSTGAALINFLLVSPTAVPGLFHRAILMSGSVHSPWSEIPDALSVTARLAKHMYCPLPSDLNARHPETMRCLRNISAQKLVNAGLPEYKFNFMFGPSVDGVVVARDFKTRPITNLGGGQAPIAVIFGIPEDEGLRHLTRRQRTVGLSIQDRNRIFRTFVRNNFRAHHQEIYLAIVKEYSDWTNQQSHPLKVRDLVADALSDGEVVAPLVCLGKRLGNQPNTRAFMYILNHHDRRDHQYLSTSPSSMYGSEIPLVFGIPFSQSPGPWPWNFTQQDLIVSDMLMTYWGNFAKTGDPKSADEHRLRLTHKDRGKQKATLWEPFDTINQKYLEIGSRVREKSRYRSSKLALWNWLIPALDDKTNEEQIKKGQENKKSWWNADSLDSHHFIGRVRPIINDRNGSIPTNPSITTLGIQSSPNEYWAPNISASQGNINPYGFTDDGKRKQLRQGVHHFLDYKSALTIVVFIGLSLLVLNAILIAVLIYHKDRNSSSEHVLQYDEPSPRQMNKSCNKTVDNEIGKSTNRKDRKLSKSHPEIQYTELKSILTPPDIIDQRKDTTFHACNPLESVFSEATSEFNPPPPMLNKTNLVSSNSSLGFDEEFRSDNNKICICNKRNTCFVSDKGECSLGIREETLYSTAQAARPCSYEGSAGCYETSSVPNKYCSFGRNCSFSSELKSNTLDNIADFNKTDDLSNSENICNRMSRKTLHTDKTNTRILSIHEEHPNKTNFRFIT